MHLKVEGGAYYPEEEEAQQVSGGYASTRRKAVGNVIVPIAEDASHEHRCDSSAIVSLSREVDDGDNCSDKDVQAGPSHTCRSSNIYREADEVLDGASAVQHDQNSEDDGANDGRYHAMPPEQPDRYERGTKVVATGTESHRQVVGEVVLPFPAPVLCYASDHSMMVLGKSG